MYNEKNVLSCKTEESVVDCFSIRREAVVCYYGLLLRLQWSVWKSYIALKKHYRTSRYGVSEGIERMCQKLKPLL